MEREIDLIKLCMKHFREQSYLSALAALQEDTGVQLESPSITDFYQLIINGQFRKSEQYLEENRNHLFREYIDSKPAKGCWSQIENTESGMWPGPRGGHHMCIDSERGCIYLFGGWDGSKDLADLWHYQIDSNVWTLLDANTENSGGPSARSCHKIILDSKNQVIFLLGRYLDLQYRSPESVKSDFYKYDIKSKKWTQLSSDSSQENGPKLLYDHQMCIDEDSQKLYVYGGRYLVPFNLDASDTFDYDNNCYSGMFQYDIVQKKWQALLLDKDLVVRAKFQSRVGHSMVFDYHRKKLLIFFGQRGKKYFTDIIAYDTCTDDIEFWAENTKKGPHLPIIGYTHKTTIDVEKREVYILAGLTKSKEKLDGAVHKNLWIYNIDDKKWISIKNRIEKNELVDCEPLKRFAHQFVYDSKNKVHYLFGGNPGYKGCNNYRLNDFWKMLILKPSVDEVLFKMKLAIRMYWYEELSKTNPYEALMFLRNDLYGFFNHNNTHEEERYRKLVMHVFKSSHKQHVFLGKRKLDEGTAEQTIQKMNISVEEKTTVDIKELFFKRSKLFDNLMKYFPRNLVQPSENLMELFMER